MWRIANYTIIIIRNNIMTNKKKVLVGSFAAVIAAGALGVSVTSAHFGPECQNHAAVEEAIRNNNSKAFRASAKKRSRSDKLNTRKEFSAIATAHNLRREGKLKQARQTLEEVGIEHPGRDMRRYRRGANIKDAIENNDWNEFKQISENKKIGNIINTRDKFELFVEAHELHQMNRHDEAHQIMDTLGLRHK